MGLGTNVESELVDRVHSVTLICIANASPSLIHIRNCITANVLYEKRSTIYINRRGSRGSKDFGNSRTILNYSTEVVPMKINENIAAKIYMGDMQHSSKLDVDF